MDFYNDTNILSQFRVEQHCLESERLVDDDPSTPSPYCPVAPSTTVQLSHVQAGRTADSAQFLIKR